MKLLSGIFIFVIVPICTFSQSIEKEFSAGDEKLSPIHESYFYHFFEDNSFQYEQYTYNITMSSYLTHSSKTGSYVYYNDTIELVYDANSDYDSSIQPGRFFHFDTIAGRIIDLNTYLSYQSGGGDLRQAKMVSLVNHYSKDTWNYFLPIASIFRDSLVTFEFGKTYFPCLDFLKDVAFNYNEEAYGLNVAGYDEEGRLTAYCLDGWFDMSSIPTVIQIRYAPDSDLIERIHYSSMDTHFANSDPFYTFDYDEDGSLIRIKFFASEEELVEEYRVEF